MDWQSRFREHQVYTWYQTVQRRPSWVTRGALTAAVIVVVVPLLLLTLTAVVVGLAVFFCLSAVAWLAKRFRGAPRAETDVNGRRNVRVIER